MTYFSNERAHVVSNGIDKRHCNYLVNVISVFTALRYAIYKSSECVNAGGTNL